MHDSCLVHTLLSSMAFVWLTPLLEHQSPLFNDFDAILNEFNATFENWTRDPFQQISYDPFCQGS